MVRSQLRAKINAAGASIALACFSFAPLFAQESIVVDEPVFVSAGDVEVLELPTDNLSPSDIENANAIEIEEIVLEKDAEIIIPPFRSIIIQKLVAAEGARIQVAHSDSGGEGAEARFFVKRIRGHIVMEAQGEKGRDGRDGRHGRQGRDGENGRDARTLFFGLIWLGDGDDGRPGYPGEDGEDGEDGQDGGHGGKLTMYYSEKTSDSKIMMDVAGGAAGLAGKPGLGGLGGNGGSGGDGWKDGSQGPMGRRGLNGRSGRPGRPGHPGKAAIYQVSDSLYRCLMMLDARSSVETLTDDDFDFCRDPETSGPVAKVKTTVAKPVVQSSSEFEISEGEGLVFISADGEDGRSAVNARLASASAETATSGSNGGSMTVFVKDLPDRAVLSSRGGRGGNGGNGARGTRGGDGRDGRNAGLFHKATVGENGVNGGHGGNGSDGGHGGRGGHIRVVYIVSNSEAYDSNWTNRLDINVAGGAGGQMGYGADAGEGGRGGRGGKKFWSSSRVADGWPGIAGVRGKNGRDGSQGEDGEIEFFEARSTTDWIVEEFKAELERQ